MGILIDHFKDKPRDVNGTNTGWSELWESEQSDLWDRGKPSPALVDFIESDSPLVPSRPQSSSSRQPTALVPGCGRGYDVVMLALHGFDAWGLEISQIAVDTAEKYALEELRAPKSYNWGSSKSTDISSIGSARFVCGDFFSEDFSQGGKSTDGDIPQEFDLVYDYTFLCALPPESRVSWRDRMTSLLTQTGILVCLEFPMYKSLDAEGPPWGLNGVHWNLLTEGGDGRLHDSDETSGSEEVSEGEKMGLFERVLYLRPERTYEVGQRTDMLSVWKLKRGH